MKRFKKRVLFYPLMIVVLLIPLLMSGCGAQEDEVWIAVAAPMTGENAQYGEFMRQAAELAVEEINAAGGVDGKTLMLQVEDDKMDPKEASIVAEKLSGDKKIKAVVGHFSSSTSLAAIPIYDQNTLTMITPSSTSPALSGSSHYFFRACVTDRLLGQLIAQYVLENLNPEKVAVMYAISDGPIANKDRFIELVEQAGVEVVADEAHEDSDKDFTAVLTRIADLEPDLIYLSSFYTPAALIRKQAQEVGLTDVDYIGMDGIYATDLIAIGGDSVEGTMAGGFFHADSPVAEAAAFINAYRQKWDEDPEGYGANAYDAVYMIAEAMEKNGLERKEIADYLDGLGSANPAFSGVTGPTSFDENHDCSKAVVIAEVRDGVWEYVATQIP